MEILLILILIGLVTNLVTMGQYLIMSNYWEKEAIYLCFYFISQTYVMNVGRQFNQGHHLREKMAHLWGFRKIRPVYKAVIVFNKAQFSREERLILLFSESRDNCKQGDLLRSSLLETKTVQLLLVTIVIQADNMMMITFLQY